MIADSHCHAWRRWPYDIRVPDPNSRGSAEALLWEMDGNGVDRAAIVCARIGGGYGGEGFGNPDNNGYVAEFARAHPDRITAWVDVDCAWRAEYHTVGAGDRLRREVESNSATGFTHYVDGPDDGWFDSADGQEFFAIAADLGIVASLAVSASWLGAVRTVAAANPTLPVLLHHMGTPRQGSGHTGDLDELLACAAIPNIGVKVSGFNYNSRATWDFPYADAQTLVSQLYGAFGGDRLYWGSDFPASRDMLTYRQAMEVIRSHCDFLPPEDVVKIMGVNLDLLLNGK